MLMSQLDITQDVEYPESDGRPVGETDLHIEWIFHIRELFHLQTGKVLLTELEAVQLAREAAEAGLQRLRDQFGAR
jgi:hypothetical protein